MPLELHIPNHIHQALRGQQSASKSLLKFEDAARAGKPIQDRFMKRSGTSSAGVFEPYESLGLHHVKLDFAGRNGGDPLLVLQQRGAEAMVAVALASHRSFATSNFATCRQWLWDNRDELDWNLSERTLEIRAELEREFGPPASTGRQW